MIKKGHVTGRYKTPFFSWHERLFWSLRQTSDFENENYTIKVFIFSKSITKKGIFRVLLYFLTNVNFRNKGEILGKQK